MNMKCLARPAILAALLLVLVGCGERVVPADPEVVSLFRDVTVHFTPDDSTLYDSPFASAKDKGRIMSTYREMTGSHGPGRVLLSFQVRPIRKDIRNMVDRWDRAGWIRLVKPGMAPVEMARFMTAYGGEISHEVDITHLAPLLNGHCEFEVFIDTWVSPAWKVDAELEFVPSSVGGVDPPAWALGALFPYGGLTAEKPSVTAEVVIPEHTRWVEVAAITTGHCTDGRDADEFITKDNVLLVDGQEVYRWRPWREDCEDFRTVNPYCAKWSDGSWSSDYSRSGWCPGDVAEPEFIDLSGWLKPGVHTLTWKVEDIRAKDPEDPDGHHGYWRISASVSGWK
jgi:hypothetical protein